jgi:phosphodiesterase/alkaline phosphatase D-like protein
VASTTSELTHPVFSTEVEVDEGKDGVVSLALDGLKPGTKYYYAVEVDGVVDQGRQGSVSTFPEAGASFSILVGACARTGSNGLVFEAMRQQDALLYIVTGDIHYENITTNSIDKFRDAYTTLVTSPAQQALYLETPIAYVWDDHDFGGSNSNGSSAAKEAARLAYRENVPHYELAAGDGNEPIYTSFDVGDVHFIVTDSRSVRDSEDYPGGGKSLLGAEQREWLKGDLLRGSKDYQLVVLVSAVPWIAPEDAARDDWGGYAGERKELANFIADNGITNLMMLAGDAHMLAIDDGSNTDYSDRGGAGFPLLHAAALDRPGSVKGGPYSEGAYPGAGQYGLVTFRYEAGGLTVEMKGLNWTGETVVDYSFAVPSPVVRAGALSGGN